ncbi:hypothetical protein JYP52_21400 [Nitratireductor aquibiodomus]|uniref:hypothetical protein n=1 Tax=Nitratireductor aquibiodomus TaxID=204799 RepID=UPI0019D32689|nr:hypothetical protein [Nitratireductor aquibiodomus]MBN7763698.1 hypothetical protein [Nitratireductor aquibiodomus]
MSAQVNTYVMFGVILDYEQAHSVWRHDDPAYPSLFDVLEPYMDDAFKTETNPKDGLTVLYDGMSGKYIAIGHVIAKTGNFEHFENPVSAIGDMKAPAKDFLEPLSALLTRLDLPPGAPRSALGWHVISHHR